MLTEADTLIQAADKLLMSQKNMHYENLDSSIDLIATHLQKNSDCDLLSEVYNGSSVFYAGQ
jgi:hypothetical protein